MAQKGSTNSQQFAWQRSAAMLRFIRISQNAKSHCASCRIFIWKECIIRLHPTAEGMEIPMGGRQKCGKPKERVGFLMQLIPPVIYPTCNIPMLCMLM